MENVKTQDKKEKKEKVTGTYIYDKKSKKLVKVSDEIPKFECIRQIYCPEGGYYDTQLFKRFLNKRQKLAYLQENNLYEVSISEQEKKIKKKIRQDKVNDLIKKKIKEEQA